MAACDHRMCVMQKGIWGIAPGWRRSMHPVHRRLSPAGCLTQDPDNDFAKLGSQVGLSAACRLLSRRLSPLRFILKDGALHQRVPTLPPVRSPRALLLCALTPLALMLFSSLLVLAASPLLHAASVPVTKAPHDHGHVERMQLPKRWYQESGHRVERLFRRGPDDGVTRPAVGSPGKFFDPCNPPAS